MYLQETSNYDKYPVLPVKGDGYPLAAGWDSIMGALKTALGEGGGKTSVLAVDCYQGIRDDEVLEALVKGLRPGLVVNTLDCFRDEEEIRELTLPDVTDDRLFGYLTRLVLGDFLGDEKVMAVQKNLTAYRPGRILVYGPGAALIVPEADILVYADLARWEIQKRFKKNMVDSLGISDREEGFEPHYKRGWFVDWRVLDRHKKGLLPEIDFYLDTNTPGKPIMARGTTFRSGMDEAARRPFRMVPYFDPGPWGEVDAGSM